MTTKTELLKARKDLIEKAPILYQVSTFNAIRWAKDYPQPKKDDFKLAFIKEALTIWTTQIYTIDGISRALGGDIGGWKTELDNLVDISKRKVDVYNSDNLKKYINERSSLPFIYDEFNDYISEIEQAKTKAEQDRDSRPNINLTDYQTLLNNQEKHTPEQLEKHKPEDLKPTDYEQIKQDLATAQQASKTAQEAQAKAEQATKDKEQELKTSKEQQIGQESELKNNLFKVSRKLMMLYNEQIKKATELFYQDLSLDNNLVNEKYGNKDKPYLYYLARTSTETEPEQVISAFRIVALIVATEQAQAKSDEYKNIASLKAPIKKMNLKRFNKVKETWEKLSDEAEPQEANNPLYLPIIKNKNQYIEQIDKIISIWQ